MIIFFINQYVIAPQSPAWGARGRVFESLRPDHIIQGVTSFYLATPFYFTSFLPLQNHWLWVESSRLPRGRTQALALTRGLFTKAAPVVRCRFATSSTMTAAFTRCCIANLSLLSGMCWSPSTPHTRPTRLPPLAAWLSVWFPSAATVHLQGAHCVGHSKVEGYPDRQALNQYDRAACRVL
jgi:hypothetical protein